MQHKSHICEKYKLWQSDYMGFVMFWSQYLDT